MSFSSIITPDGTAIVRDPVTGQTASGRTLPEAEAELRRLRTATPAPMPKVQPEFGSAA